MNRDEALEILRSRLDQLEQIGFEALATRIGENDVLEIEGASGARYQVELNILWDAAPGGTIRVLGSVDDGGLRAFLPLTDSRLVEPFARP